MSTRRSTRVRARDGDDGAENSATGEKHSPLVRVAKRARKSDAEDAADHAETKAVPLEWVHQTLSEDKRAAWDALLKTHFHLHKPLELYDLYELAVCVSPENPLEAFVASAGIRLTGPFELFTRGDSTIVPTKPLYLHGRFFLDPPEVVSVLEDTESTSGAHWGLYRDKPSESPSYVVHTTDASVCAFEPVALSLFMVLRDRLETRSNIGVAESHLKHFHEYIKAKGLTHTKMATAVQNQRSKEALATSLHGLGIVVPFDAKKRSGFRELPIVGENLRELLAHVTSGDAAAKKKLTNLLTRATIANDECDFGTSLLLGLDIFTTGTALQKEALQMLRVAYMLLGRKEFAKVASDHAKHRTPGLSPLDCLSTNASETSGLSIALP